MELEVSNLPSDELYKLITQWVAPRPIAWVSTTNKEGIINLAPFSFFNLVCDEPPVVMLSISKREDGTQKDTARNILETGEFVVNFVEWSLLEKVKLTGEDFPPSVSELELAGLTPEPSKKVKPPRVKESPASFECRLIKHMELFNYDVIFGEVVFLVVRKECVKRVGRIGESFCNCVA
ncbi:flavin reductase family protein [Thermocrinis jamiesonii]|uniref:flavin reductase family protein n=1 Tax=Thermocrinis jamiesonii TaxID=1302351 RepID=UPI000495484E|nr:flavin reductase family protein [Thermocrinis jamiesonii]